MIQEAVRGMAVLMMAKFILNDVPHAAKLTLGSTEWSQQAWNSFMSFLHNKGYSVEALERSLHEDLVWKQDIIGLKKVLGCYYLLAEARAPDIAVDEAYRILRKKMVKDISAAEQFCAASPDAEGCTGDTLRQKAVSRLDWEDPGYDLLWSLYIDGTRADKVIAVDSTVHAFHMGGPLLDRLFDFHGTELSELVGEALTWLAV